MGHILPPRPNATKEEFEAYIRYHEWIRLGTVVMYVMTVVAVVFLMIKSIP